MDARKDNNNRNHKQNHKQNQDSREKRSFSLPPTSSRPPMPPVKPPKK